jgi:hypothetical protein
MLHEYHISAVSPNHGMSWNVLPADTGALQYFHKNYEQKATLAWENIKFLPSVLPVLYY